MSQRQMATCQNHPEMIPPSNRDFGGRLRRRDQQGLPVHQAEGKGRARPGLQDHGAAAPRDRRPSRHADEFCSPCRICEFTGGRIARAKYQYTLQSGDIDALYSKSPEMEKAIAQLPGLRDVNSDLQITNPQAQRRDRSRKGGGLRHHDRPGPHRALQRLWHAADLDHFHRGRRLSGDHGGRRELPERSFRAGADLCFRRRRRPRAAQRSGDDEAHGRAAADQSSVAAARGDDLVQSRARYVARPGDRGHPRASSARPICLRASSPALPATRSSSSRRWRGKARCCSPPC